MEWPGKKFQSSMPQTKLNLLGQNLIPNQCWGHSGAGKVWPQANLRGEGKNRSRKDKTKLC